MEISADHKGFFGKKWLKTWDLFFTFFYQSVLIQGNNFVYTLFLPGKIFLKKVVDNT
jgi:hypothetical protein